MPLPFPSASPQPIPSSNANPQTYRNEVAVILAEAGIQDCMNSRIVGLTAALQLHSPVLKYLSPMSLKIVTTFPSPARSATMNAPST